MDPTRGAGALALGLTMAFGGCADAPPDTDATETRVLTVLVDREDPVLRAVLEAFEGRSSIPVDVVVEVVAPRALLPRLTGRDAAVDLVVTDDAAAFVAPGAAELLSAVDSRTLAAAVPEGLRDPGRRWWGIAQRTRLLAHRCGEAQASPASLEALADSVWQGRVLVGAEGPTTVRALVADAVARRGDSAAAAWAPGLLASLARPPAGDDGDQVSALVAGEGSVAVVDSRALAERGPGGPCVVYPGQEGDGAPITIVAAAVAGGVRRRGLAVRLLEHLVSEESQTSLAWTGNLYPVREGVPWSPVLLGWGGFRADTTGPGASRGAEAAAAGILQRLREDEASPDSAALRTGAAPEGGAAPAPPGRRPPPGTARPPGR